MILPLRKNRPPVSSANRKRRQKGADVKKKKNFTLRQSGKSSLGLAGRYTTTTNKFKNLFTFRVPLNLVRCYLE